MSLEAVKQIIGQAMANAEFRRQLLDAPAEALKGYELSEEEAAMLMNLPRENFEAAASELGERISRAGLHLDSTSPDGGEDAEANARIKVRFPWLDND